MSKEPLKEIELKLMSELMKNSRRSDRQLARALDVSQPTVGRIRTRLEKEGYIREYTMIPTFSKLGFQLLGLTFIKIKKELSDEQIEKVRETTRQRLDMSRFGIVMLERGMGMNYDGVIMCFYKEYSEYSEHRSEISKYPFVELSTLEGFLISLDDAVRYRPLTLSILSEYLLREFKSRKKEA